jgi:hypothetical protein
MEKKLLVDAIKRKWGKYRWINQMNLQNGIFVRDSERAISMNFRFVLLALVIVIQERLLFIVQEGQRNLLGV